jgi:hypothetical protein
LAGAVVDRWAITSGERHARAERIGCVANFGTASGVEASDVVLYANVTFVTSRETLRVAETGGGVTQTKVTSASFVPSADVQSDVGVDAFTEKIVTVLERLATISSQEGFSADVRCVVDQLTGAVGVVVADD